MSKRNKNRKPAPPARTQPRPAEPSQNAAPVQPAEKPVRLLIIGSCATRDAFEFVPHDDFVISDYVARSSLASAFADPFVLPDAVNVASAWQKRMLICDSQKELDGIIRKADWDVLVLDLIDERFEIAVRGSRVVTRSVAFGEAGLYDYALKSRYEFLPFNNPERGSMWARGWRKLLDAAQAANPNGKIILNKVQWVYDPSFFPRVSRTVVEDNNKALRSMYRVIERQDSANIQAIEYNPETFAVDINHKWGPAPFHYTIDTYKEFMWKLRAITQA